MSSSNLLNPFKKNQKKRRMSRNMLNLIIAAIIGNLIGNIIFHNWLADGTVKKINKKASEVKDQVVESLKPKDEQEK